MCQFEDKKITPITKKRIRPRAKSAVSDSASSIPVRILRGARVFQSPEALADGVAREWIKLAQEAIAIRGSFHVALSGGSTPKILYERLAKPDYAARPEWRNTYIWFGDERAVPPDHEQSNYRMAKQALLDRVPIPPVQVFRIEGEQQDLKKAAMAYSRKLAMNTPQAENGMPQLDLVLLGMGDDGHVASLFPGTDALTEARKLVMPVYVEKLKSWRITFTLPLINHARRVLMLVCGAGKANMMGQVFGQPGPLPVQRVAPVSGRFEWRLDNDAAARL